MANEDKSVSGLTIDRAAFLLLRVKRAFKKKKQDKKEASLGIKASDSEEKSSIYQIHNYNCNDKYPRPAPLLRSKTLPAIIVPNINVFPVQVNTYQITKNEVEMMNVRKKNQFSIAKDNSESITSTVNNNKFYQPRVLFTDHIFVFKEQRESTKIMPHPQSTSQYQNIITSCYKQNNDCSLKPRSSTNDLFNQQINYNIQNNYIFRSISMDNIFHSTSLNCCMSNHMDNLTSNIPLLDCKYKNKFDVNTEPRSHGVFSHHTSQNVDPQSMFLARKCLKINDKQSYFYHEIGRHSKRQSNPDSN